MRLGETRDDEKEYKTADSRSLHQNVIRRLPEDEDSGALSASAATSSAKHQAERPSEVTSVIRTPPADGVNGVATGGGTAGRLIISAESPDAKALDKCSGAALVSDVYSTLTVDGSGDEHPPTSISRGYSLIEQAILARVAAIPRSRAARGRDAAIAEGEPFSRSMQPGSPPVEKSFRRIFHRTGSDHKIPAAPKCITCLFCGEMLHFPAQLPCTHLADLECLIDRIPLEQCPICRQGFSGNKSLMDLVVPDQTLRKVEKERMIYLSKLRGKDRRLLGRTDPIHSPRALHFMRKATEQELLYPDTNIPPHNVERTYHRLNPMRLFRRRHCFQSGLSDVHKGKAE